MSVWVPAVLVFIAVAFATVALVLVLEGARAALRSREVARRVDELMAGTDVVGSERRQLFREADRVPTVLDAILARSRLFRGLPTLIEHAAVQWSVTSFVLLTLGVAAAGGMVGLVVRGGLLVPVILATATAWLPYLYLRSRRKRRLNRFEEIFPEAVDMLGRAIRAGHPLSAGIQMVGQEMAEPVSGEFRTVFEEQRFGVPFPDALMGLVDRIDLVDVRIFVTAVLIQREVGGNLSEILEAISSTVRARFKIRRQLRTYTAQGRLSGMVVGLMPIVVALAFYALNPEYIRLLFEHPVGRLMVLVGVSLQIIGYLWIRRIVNIEI